ncbi:MAG TPA: response regulator [Polyangiaceae bacterium]|jgi:DNA-binding response OmpR family regulator
MVEDEVSLRAAAARVVVAEDDADMRAMVADALRRDGHQVIELTNGGELLVRIAHQYRRLEPAARVDLYVSDVRMPVVSGLEILRGLRDAHCTTPVILMTAFGDAQTRKEAESLGAVLMDKPLRLDDLRKEVRRLLAVGA